MSGFGGNKKYKRDYNKVNPIVKTEQEERKEPECLIIPGLGGRGSGSTDLVLVPCGEVDGCILYVEARDPHAWQDSGLEQGQLLEE